mmetsp:Transcript_13240/g.26381  ORF Transcript_13240/g.26381 Transcript_13240/m.26381 type:complete len:735 (+) Transcript_13240:212-2416(+)
MVASTAPRNSPQELCQFEKGGKYWTMDSDGEGYLASAAKGYASLKKTPQDTLHNMFLKSLKRNASKVTLRTENMGPWKKGDPVPEALDLDKWKSWTLQEFYNDSKKVAKAMIANGFVAHDAANIFGFNSPEWVIAMYGAIFAGGKAAGLYGSDNTETVQFKSHHSNGSIAFVESMEQFNKFKECLDDIPYMKAIVTWACDAGEDLTRSDGSVVKTFSFTEFVALGAEQSDDEVQNRIDGLKPSNACAIIYTSGTTGNPKAVMISHDNIIFEAYSVAVGVIGFLGKTRSEERVLSYLPLSHIAGMMLDGVVPLTIGVYTKGWCSVNFARPYDLKASTIGDRLKAVRPTVFFGVPRVWEKIQEKLLAVGAALPDGLKKKLAAKAKKRSLFYQEGQQLGGHGKKPGSLAIYNILLKKIKGKLGLDKCKFMFAGAAPMTTACLSYFGSIGINVNEVYGMSECTGACTFSTDKFHLWGTIGFEIPGVEVKIFKVDPDTGAKTECPAAKDIFNATEEEQGEICFRGRNTMMGYMANPKFGDEHMKTIEGKNMGAIDDEGWLHSGDKGAIGLHGMVKITGRYKELIIGAGGENIAPVPIEDALKEACTGISNIVMIGNKRKFNVALVTLKAVGATGEVPGTDELDGAAAKLSAAKTITEARSDETVIKTLTAAFEAVNANGKVVVSNASKIQKFTILPRDFSVQTGELTATLKLKRSVVDNMYEDIIEKMYASSDVYVPYE